MLSGTFAESKLKDFSEPIDQNEHAENYGYHSDSDLEDDEDAVDAGKATKKAAPPMKHTPDLFLFPPLTKHLCVPMGSGRTLQGREWS